MCGQLAEIDIGTQFRKRSLPVYQVLGHLRRISRTKENRKLLFLPPSIVVKNVNVKLKSEKKQKKTAVACKNRLAASSRAQARTLFKLKVAQQGYARSRSAR